MSKLKDRLLESLGRQLPGANMISDECEEALNVYIKTDAVLARSLLSSWTGPNAISEVSGDSVALVDICKICKSRTKNGNMCDLTNALVNAVIDRDRTKRAQLL